MGGGSSKTSDLPIADKGGGEKQNPSYAEFSNMESEPIKFDPHFKGPIQNRSCTDILCCLLFLIFFLAFIIIGIYAFVMGDPRYLLYPTDSDGNLCGVGSFSDKPDLFYFDLVACFLDAGRNPLDITNILNNGCPTPQICVAACPKVFWSLPSNGIQDAQDAICRYNIPNSLKTNQNIWGLVGNQSCAPYYLPSSSIAGRCIPLLDQLESAFGIQFTNAQNQTINSGNITAAATGLAKYINIGNYGIQILGDVTASWGYILVFLLIAVVLSFIWIALMRWLAGIIVWIAILLFIAFFAFSMYYCFTHYIDIKNNQLNDTLTELCQHYTQMSFCSNLYQTWLALGIISAIILLIVLLILLFLRTRLLIAIALIKEASRGISHMMFTLLWPLIPYVLQMVVLAYWGGSAICLAAASSGPAVCNLNVTNGSDPYMNARCTLKSALNYIPCNASGTDTAGTVCNFVRNGGGTYTYVLQAFQLFMLFWLMNFVIALGQLTLAGAFASYYWAFNKPADIPIFPVSFSLGRAVRYHLGSLAFGSLIVAIIQMIRAVLEYVDHKLKGSGNVVARFFIKCCICCLWCLEKFMKFINKNAYIMIAVYGKNFCTSAKDAFMLIMRNVIRVAVVDKVTDFLLFVSKLLIVGAVGVFSYFFFAREIPGVRDIIPSPTLTYYLVPVIIIILGTYVVATLFFGVYNMGVDTLFLCFLEDLERNDGTPEKPYYFNKELKGILGKSNKTK